MNFELTQLPVEDIEGDIEVIIVIDNHTDHVFVQDKKLLKKAGFKGGQDETCLLVSKNRLYVGADSTLSKNIRTAAANAIKVLKGTGYRSIKVASYLHSSKCTNSLRAMVEGFILGAYSFEQYKTKKNENKIKHITISLDEYNGYKINIEKASLLVHKAQI
ncbi:MAG: M17 family peptidase N-terminal domain-containing protein, partial [Sulfurovum sp.]|uniref:M17 family peptidase N-terminal domain-containing protein n=1 Tax=Sulfurovum sp. TaxID=1969726 RepID=UPI003C73C449